MPATTTATLQTIWDCRFSRPGHRLTHVVDELQPEPLWVCVREGERRTADEETCTDCPHWEQDIVTPLC